MAAAGYVEVKSKKEKQAMKEVIFHCPDYPELVLTVVPFNAEKGANGVRPKAKHLMFKPDVELGSGILRCGEEDAKIVKERDFFKRGLIKEVFGKEDIPAEVKADKVQRGVHDTREVRNPQGEPPADGSHAVRAAKVPGKKK